MLQVRVWCGCGPWSGAHGDAGHEWRYADIPSACLPFAYLFMRAVFWICVLLVHTCPVWWLPSKQTRRTFCVLLPQSHYRLITKQVFQAVTWRSSTFLVLFLRAGYLTRVFNSVVQVYFLNSFRNASVKFLKLVSTQILKAIKQILEARLRIGPICTILPPCSEKTLKIYIVLGVDMHCSCGNCQEILHLRIITTTIICFILKSACPVVSVFSFASCVWFLCVCQLCLVVCPALDWSHLCSPSLAYK